MIHWKQRSTSLIPGHVTASTVKPSVMSLSMITLTTLLTIFTMTLFYGCSGSSGGGSAGGGTTTGSVTAVAGYKMPSEISAVPSKTTAQASNLTFSKTMKALARASKAATDAGTDYSLAQTRKYVEENTLKQFDMIETILNAVNQTNYSDEINNGAYKAMVAFNDEEGGIEKKSLEPWVVQADAIVENGLNILRLRAWIEEEEDHVVKAEFKILAPPVQNDDGSYADYGEWTLNVKFDDTGENFYALSCEAGDEGAILKVHEINDWPGEPSSESMAIMIRGESTGYGKVIYPNHEAFWGPDGDQSLTAYPTIEAQYAYNANFLAVQQDDGPIGYKNRNSVVNMTHRYGVFNNSTGKNIMKSKQFGFPIRYTTSNGTMHSYYGAWQGRHQIWTPDGNPIPEDTVVTREDLPPGQEITYTVGPTFNGTLVKRSLVDATLADIQNIPVEIWINNDYTLMFDGGTWKYCEEMTWPDNAPPECAVALKDFDTNIGLESLIVDPNDFRKHVYVGGWDMNASMDRKYVYLKAGTYDFNGNSVTVANGEDDFYLAEENQGRLYPVSPLTAIVTADVNQLWVGMGGSIYVEYNGTSWIEKELLFFDERNWTPEFGDNDKAYVLPENKELYINMQGANYIVEKTGGVTTVKLELQTAVNPQNVATLVPAGTVFVNEWNPDSNSTYELITDSASPKYMMLVFRTIGDDHTDQNGDAEVQAGDIATNIWGITATVGTSGAFNWEYNADGGWGAVSYLMDGNNFLMLDDPVRFEPITVSNGAGDSKTLSLQFDGWMGGLPDMYMELQKNDWVITSDISNKIINLPDGTLLTETGTSTVYVLKPLEISQFLVSVSEPSAADRPDITAADNLDMSTVPDYVEHGMGDMPASVETLYSEGLPIE